MLKTQADHLKNQCFFGVDGVPYCVYKLVVFAEARYPVVELPVATLADTFNGETESDEPDGSPEFVERAMQAEDFPILVQRVQESDLLPQETYLVMDGRHRLWKAMTLGQRTIKARVVPEIEMPQTAVCSDEVQWLV